MKAMLNPEGRIDPGAFRDAAITLIVIGAIFSLLPLVASPLLSFVSLVLIYPWTVIWVKRFHDAGKSGWMFLAVLVPWLAAQTVAGRLISAKFAPTPAAQPTNFSAAMDFMNAQAQAIAIPNTIAAVVISLVFVLVGNALLKSDPGPNAYDPLARL